jgi:TonB-dependent receptor
MIAFIRRSIPAVILIFFAVSIELHGQSPKATPNGQSGVGGSGSLSGAVTDKTGAVLPGAQIVLKPSASVAATNTQGDFVIQNLKPGTYTATVSDVGFADFTSTITITAGQNTVLTATLSISSTSQRVVVNANLEGDAMEVNEQRTAENILNVTTAETIQSLPNQSVATVLGRMPGVTVQINEGEAQYVQIRGTEPRLSNTTVDGLLLPGPDPQVRQVDLWVIPGDLVGAVEINKTLSANEDGDAIGGSVNMTMKQATSTKPTIQLESLGGYNPIDTGQAWFRDDATIGKRFGPQGRFGAIFTYSYDLNDLGTDDVEPVPDISPVDNVTPEFNAISEREYFYNHTRYGFGGSLDYKLNATSDLFVHGLFSNFRDFGSVTHYDINAGYPTLGQPGSISSSVSVRRPNYQIAHLIIGGNQIFNHVYFRYAVAASHTREGGAAGNPGADYDPLTDVNGNPVIGNDCVYTPAANPSKFRPQFSCGSDPIFDATKYALNDLNLTSGQATQLNLQAVGTMGINYNLGGHSSVFEFGGLIRNAHKGQYANSPTYDCGGSTPCTITPPLMSQFTTSFTNPSYYGGSYKFGPVTNFDYITKWLAANPGVIPLDNGATHLNSDPANYNLEERVTAGYLMNTINFGGKFHLQTGLRFEATNESNTGYLVINDVNGNYVSTNPVNGGGSYVDALPSVQFRYNIDTNSDVRAVYGRGISRPDPYELVPYQTLDESSTPNTENIGNPALVAEHAQDFDLLYERFLPSVGMIEGGYFYKHLTTPLFQMESTVPNPFPNPITPTVKLQQWVNGGHAYVQGVELAYQQHLSYLPGVLANARIDANVTFTQSRNFDLTGRSDSPALVSQAPWSFNLNPSYATKRALVSIGVSYDGPNIAAYQWQDGTPGGIKGPNGDNYYYERTQVDAQASYYLGKGLTITASEENANNAVLGFYNGSPQYMVQREYYKPIYYGGLRWESGREK